MEGMNSMNDYSLPPGKEGEALIQQRHVMLDTILEIKQAVTEGQQAWAASNPLQPYRKEYDALFKELQKYFEMWNPQETEKLTVLKKKDWQKEKEDEKLIKEETRLVAKTSKELTDILLKHGSVLFKATWKPEPELIVKGSGRQDVSMRSFYSQVKTYATVLETERNSVAFQMLDHLVQWIQRLNNYLIIKDQLVNIEKAEAEAIKQTNILAYKLKQPGDKKNYSLSDWQIKEFDKLVDRFVNQSVVLLSALRYSIVHFEPKNENANLVFFYNRIAGMGRRWLRNKVAELFRQLPEEGQKDIEDIWAALVVFDAIKNEIQQQKMSDRISSKSYPEIYKLLEKQPNEEPSKKDIQYLILQMTGRKLPISKIVDYLKRIEAANIQFVPKEYIEATDTSMRAEAATETDSELQLRGKKDRSRTENQKADKSDREYEKLRIRASANLTAREARELKADLTELKTASILASQKKKDMLALVVTMLRYEHGKTEEEIARETGIPEKHITRILTEAEI